MTAKKEKKVAGDNVPLCYGQYRDSQEYCLGCEHRNDCVDELVKSILEGRSIRPSKVMTLTELMKE